MKEISKRKFNFTIGIFDGISEKIKLKIKEESNECETYGVGVYTDKFVIDNFMTYPSKALEIRQENVKKINGVDFTFSVNTSDASKVKKIIESEYQKYLQNK